MIIYSKLKETGHTLLAPIETVVRNYKIALVFGIIIAMFAVITLYIKGMAPVRHIFSEGYEKAMLFLSNPVQKALVITIAALIYIALGLHIRKKHFMHNSLNTTRTYDAI